MPKLAGRRAFYAALAVPIAMVIAPLTASAGEADEAVVTSQAQPGAVATENGTAHAAELDGFTHGPDWYIADDADVVHNESEDTSVTYVVNGIHDDTVIGNSSEETTVFSDEDEGFSPGPDWWYGSDDVNVVHSESEDTNVTYVVNGIYDDSVVGNSDEETTVFVDEDSDDSFSPGPDWYESDDVNVVNHESEDTNVTYVVNGIHDDTVIGNSDEETTVFADGVDEDEVAYEEVAHDEVAYEDDDADVYVDADNAFEDDDDSTVTSFEEVSAGAGNGGAYFDSTEGGSFELD
jgi:hypothetical protein